MNDKKPSRPRCKFDMFCKLRPGIISEWPKQSRLFTMRGDAYTDEVPKMLCKLLTHLKNKIWKYALVELYDNTYIEKFNDDLQPYQFLQQSIVIKLIVDDEGNITVEINELHRYQEYITKLQLPSYLAF